MPLREQPLHPPAWSWLSSIFDLLESGGRAFDLPFPPLADWLHPRPRAPPSRTRGVAAAAAAPSRPTTVKNHGWTSRPVGLITCGFDTASLVPFLLEPNPVPLRQIGTLLNLCIQLHQKKGSGLCRSTDSLKEGIWSHIDSPIIPEMSSLVDIFFHVVQIRNRGTWHSRTDGFGCYLAGLLSDNTGSWC